MVPIATGYDVPDHLLSDTEDSVVGKEWHQEAIGALANMLRGVADQRGRRRHDRALRCGAPASPASRSRSGRRQAGPRHGSSAAGRDGGAPTPTARAARLGLGGYSLLG